ncbi:MAG TPA: ATP-binding protein [Acidimicrobiales bacterium]
MSGHLRARLALLAGVVGTAVARRRAADPAPDDPFRGLHLDDATVERLLAGLVPPVEVPPELAAATRSADTAAADAPGGSRLLALAEGFGLDPVDLDLLVVALAPDVDPRFERCYGYLHDDVTRRRASVGLALELAGRDPADAAARRRLSAAGPLVAGGLVLVEDLDRPFLTRALRVPDRVTAHLLGADDPDPDVAHLLEPARARGSELPGARVGAVRVRAASLTYVREPQGTSGKAWAAATIDGPVLVADLDAGADLPTVAVLGREARLRGAALVAGPVDAVADDPRLVRALADLPGTVVLTGRSSWDPRWSRRVPRLVTAPEPTPEERAALWRAHLDGHLAPGVDPAAVTAHLRLTPEQIADAAAAARHLADADRPDDDATPGVDEDAIRRGARSRNGAGLERRARRIEPAAGWDDLVLPPTTLAALTELVARVRHREQVLRSWSMRPGGGRGHGITALFAGDSGTGKTMSAEVVAGALGLDLYVVDLATVVDKYVGETEKHLDRIFGEAAEVNGVLLFDEADALFGKRSEVRDAHDRYANVEVAYLLQRMETFEGLAVLTTNLRANVDEAFTRRLDAVVDFPLPDEAQRRRLWERCLGPPVPRAADVDLDFCAARFDLSGGNIRSITLTAAYLAAARGDAVTMADLMQATQREYRKLGRLCVPAEFGPWLDLAPVEISDLT